MVGPLLTLEALLLDKLDLKPVHLIYVMCTVCRAFDILV